jgi:hypothetical protein
MRLRIDALFLDIGIPQNPQNLGGGFLTTGIAVVKKKIIVFH